MTSKLHIMRRQALEEELQRTTPPATPDLDRAQTLLEGFAQFWEAEPNPAERRKLIAMIFEYTWQKDGTIIAVRPHGAFASYFTAIQEAQSKHPKAGLHSGVTKRERRGSDPDFAPHRSDGIEVWRAPPWAKGS